MTDEPFGRQPQPVRVTLEGEQVDIDFYISRLARSAEFKGDMVQRNGNTFTIYPRAVND